MNINVYVINAILILLVIRYLSHATVKTHINRIFAKTGVRTAPRA